MADMDSTSGIVDAGNLAVVQAAEKPERTRGTAMTTIVLADDHTVVRNALRMLLDAEPEFEVVAEAGDVETTVRYVRGHKPTVLILDLNMPGRSSLDAVPDILEASPETEIVVLTMQNEPAFARRALQAGVRGYVLKEAADAELVQAVRSAAVGDTYLQPALGRPPRRRQPTSGRRRAERARARRPAPDRPRPHQRRGRREALHQHPHGGEPPGSHPAEAEPLESGRVGSVCDRAGVDRNLIRVRPREGSA